MKWLFPLLCLSMIWTNLSFAQTEIKGKVMDTLSTPLASVTVMLLDAVDSTYISFTQTDKNGLFSIKSKLAKPIIVKVSYLGFFSFEKKLDLKLSNLFDLGNIHLTPINNILFEVVIKEAKAPLKMHGDTIEYDATTFKVPAGSSVEDLLRKLPGITVDANGAITSQGQGVNKLTVDGKRFFGDDPSQATKNLPAESVSKVQVFNEKTEQEKLTGLTLEKDQKTMNLELKEDFKKGGFGKVLAGIGLEERKNSTNTVDPTSKWEAKGNYNKFNKKEQLSFIAVRNNTGRNGINWNDFQDFRGQQNWEWNNAENLFGLSNGTRYYSPGNDEDFDDFGGFSGFFGDGNAGIPNNSQIGVNYNYDNAKVKYTGMYSFKQNDLISEAIRKQQFFLPDYSYTTDDHSAQNRRNGSHRAELIFEDDIDSSNTLIVKLRGNVVVTKTQISGSFNNRNQENQLTSALNLNRNTDRTNMGWQGVAYYKLKFKNKRRNFGINLIYNENDRKTDDQTVSTNNFYAQTSLDSSSILDQFIKFNTSIRALKSSLLYVEPIAKNMSLQFFYNFVQRNDALLRDVFDNSADTVIFNNFYSRDNNHIFKLNKVGTIFQYSNNGINISAGIGAQNISLIGHFQEGNNPYTSIDRSFNDLVGNCTLNFQLSNGKRLYLSYNENVTEPSFKNLSPIVDNSNPLFIRVGNPDLNPEKSHQTAIFFDGNNQAKFINYYINLNYTYYQNQHIAEQTIDSFLITTSRSVNFRGGQRYGLYASYGFPIIKNKFTIRMNYNYSYDLTKSFINAILNDANINNHGMGCNVSFTPNETYSVYLDSRLSLTSTAYSFQSQQNYKVWNQSYNLQANTKLVYSIFLNSSLNYKIFDNQRFDTKYTVPILNASIYRLFLKGGKLEARFAVYDLFNKNVSINQNVSVNQISESRTFLISRYYLLSLSYNLKGIRATVKRTEGMF